MKIGLVGFAGSGKTTVFNALTGLGAPVGYGGEVRLGTVRVPDERIDRLSEIYQPRKTTYAEMVFCDLPGEHGADRRGLSPRGLQRIRDQEALCLVLRDFASPGAEDAPDAAADLEAFHAESVLADLDIVERRLERARKEGAPVQEIAAFEAAAKTLEAERPLRALSDEALDRSYLKGYGMLTDRPLLVVVNRAEDAAAEPLGPALEARLGEVGARAIVMSAALEAELAEMPSDERADFLEPLGLDEPALDRFIRAAYELVDLISFFTVGPDEVRAWTVRSGTPASRAAGKIHSDLERGFIRAEVIPYEVFLEHGSEAAVKSAGRLQVEGKEYVVQDGEIMHVRFNV